MTKQLCNHSPNTKDTTLKKLPVRKMIHPETVEFFCPCCKKVFRFVKNDEGVFVPPPQED